VCVCVCACVFVCSVFCGGSQIDSPCPSVGRKSATEPKRSPKAEGERSSRDCRERLCIIATIPPQQCVYKSINPLTHTLDPFGPKKGKFKPTSHDAAHANIGLGTRGATRETRTWSYWIWCRWTGTVAPLPPEMAKPKNTSLDRYCGYDYRNPLGDISWSISM
jgi:hypothetical protein